MRAYLLIALLPLVACTSPKEVCTRNATEDLRNIDALIEETEQNIARGYTFDTEVVRSSRVRYCVGHGTGGNVRIGAVFCNDPYIDTKERPVAIDPKAEREKLRSLKAKRVEVDQRSQLAQASCQAQYP